MIDYEEKSLNAWPAVKTLLFKGCIIRLSNGYTKRANSANALYINEDNITEIIDFSEKIYSNSNLPTVFKIIDNNKYKKLDSTLEKKNYSKIDITNIMLKNILEYKYIEDNTLQIDDKFSDEWITAFLSINKIKDENKTTVVQMLNKICVDLIVVSIKVNNTIIACGYGACENDYVGLYDIAVDEKFRSKGYGKRIVSGLMNKAKEKNISYAYLQVVDSNTIANELYKKLGFEKIYNYWYRKKNLKDI